MTPKEIYELACKYCCEDKEMILYDGDTAWILEESLLAVWENNKGSTSICIKQV